MSEPGPPDVDVDFGRGVELHRHGALAEAERVYRNVLRQQPAHFDALYMWAVIALQTGRAARAAELLGLAIALRPDHAEAHSNLGNALSEMGRPEEALAHYDRAVTSRPTFGEAWFNRAAVLSDLSRWEQAVASYSMALALKPGLVAETLERRGVTLARLGRAAEALADFDGAIAARPHRAETRLWRGDALRDLGRFADAVASYDAAIALESGLADAHNNRANALRDLGRFAEALEGYDRALAARPDHAEAHFNRGTVLRDLKRPADAVAAYDSAIAARPCFAEAHNNRGNALRDLGWPEEALASYNRALAARPAYAEALYSRGAVLSDLGRPEAALASFDAAIAIRPDFAEAQYNKALCHLALGDFPPGWAGFEWRWKSRSIALARAFSRPRWSGADPIADKTILVHAEQGFGDSLQFCRYVPLLAGRGARVILDVPRPLARLLAGLRGVTAIVTHDDPVPDHDAWIPMMSLPLAFGTTLASIPADGPYLFADPDRTAAWRRRLAGSAGRSVGLVWAGSPLRGHARAEAMDRRRSITLRHYAGLASVPGLCLVSLQKGEAAWQTRTPQAGMTLRDWTGELDDYADTAALVAALDLVISVDTSVAHLAGALGRPVWILNRYDQCWRWLRDRTESPWYPTARLFRQTRPGDWDGVTRDVTDAIRAWAGRAIT